MDRAWLHAHRAATFSLGILLTLVASSCSSASTVSTSASSTAGAASTSAGGKTGSTGTTTKNGKGSQIPSLAQSRLNGVDAQISFSTILGSMWTSQKIKVSAIPPASLGSSNGERTLSLPITGGDFQYYKSTSSTTGSINTSGGITLSETGKPTLTITKISINLSRHEITATANDLQNTPIFIINGAPAISSQGAHTVVYGITLQLSTSASALLQDYFIPDRSLAAVTITTSGS